jgi:hypothetical protein
LTIIALYIPDEVELEILIDRRVPAVRGGGFKQRIAVGICSHDRFGGEVAAGAGAVFDNELLAEPLGEHLPREPCDNVVDATGGITDEQKRRPRRIGLRARKAAEGRQCGHARCQLQKSTAGKFHGCLPESSRDAHERRSRCER